MLRFLLILSLLSFAGTRINATKRNALFLGNSYTYVNNLPQLIADFATSLNDTLIFDSNTPGGYTLDQHFHDTVSTNKIKAGGWDFVILQEQSQLPAFEDYYSDGGNRLCQMIRQYNPCARKMYYMTWGRKNGDAGNCPVWPPICTYEGMDSLLRLRYIETADMNGTDLSPVGAVWHYLRVNFPNLELYQSDESHPSAAGSYAAACCFYASVFKKDPALSSYNSSLNATDAAIIRNAAKLVVYDSLQYWDFSHHIPNAAFNYVIGTGINEILCSNNSTNADTYSWDFGDGSFSSDTNTTHSYSGNGNYTITLNALRCDLNQVHQSTFQAEVTFCQHNPTITPDNLVICPNTQDTLWTQVFDAYQWFDNGILLPGDTNQYLIPQYGSSYTVMATVNNCAELSPAIYAFSFNPGLIIYRLDTISHLPVGDTLCLGDTVMLVLNTNRPDNSGNQIQWTLNGQVLTTAVNDTFYISSSGLYQVAVTNAICPDFNIFLSDPSAFYFINCNAGIEDSQTESLIKIYPNPSIDFIQLNVPKQFLNETYSIIDLYGTVIKIGIISSETSTISITDFANGIYFLKIHSVVQTLIKL